MLDIGAGNGFVEEFLSRKNIKIFGNNISAVVVKNLKNKFKGQFLKESVYDMEYRKNSFDAVFMLEILERISPGKIFNVLKKVKEILREKGIIKIHKKQMETQQYNYISKDSMNVLFFTRLFSPHIGGVEKHVMEVGKALIKKGHRVTVITEELAIEDIPVYLRPGRNIPRKENIGSIEVYRISIGKNERLKKFRIWITLWMHLQLIRRADIIHCHDVFFWYFPFRFLFPFKRVFATFHGYEGYPLKRKDILVRKISEKLSMGSICVGHFMKRWYKSKPDYICYGGVDIAKNKTLKARSDKSAVFVGRLDQQTGILTYVEAVKIIRKKIADFDFFAIGDGSLKAVIDKTIKVSGSLINASKYFQKYNFAFVSRYLAIMEAMSAKRLVFAVYDNPLKEDYLRMAPFSKYIVISRSVSELVSKIYFYLNNPEKKEELTEKGYRWVEKRTWEETANTYLKLWKI